MKIESTVKIKQEYKAKLNTFRPSDVFHIPFDEVVICVDNGESEGPWINLVNNKSGEEFIVQFDAPNFGWSPRKDKEAKAFWYTFVNIVRKNQIPIKFSVDANCAEASTNCVSA